LRCIHGQQRVKNLVIKSRSGDMLAEHIARSKAYDEGLVLPKTEVISILLIEHIFLSRVSWSVKDWFWIEPW
jgi:hypothetical protein